MTVRTSRFRSLTREELAVLQHIRQRHGRCWKKVVRFEWSSGRAGPLMQALRNSHGPRWLNNFHLDDALALEAA